MKKKLIRIATVPISLKLLLRNQLGFLNRYYNVIGMSSPGDELDFVAEKEGIRTIGVPMYRRINIFKDFLSIFRLYRIFRKEKPYIVHSITPKAGLVSMIAAFLARVPHRIHTFTGLVFPVKEGLMRFILMNVDRIICVFATKIIPEGEGVKKDLIKFKITTKELEVIANGNINGIDLDFFKPSRISISNLLTLKRSLSIKSSDITLIFIGRIVMDKGIKELIMAFSNVYEEIKGIKLLLVGPYENEVDPLPSNIMQLIDDHPAIVHIPFQDDIRPFLEISDIFVFPSHREGFPNVILQAGAMNLPCIVTDINGSNEIISDGLNGIIIPPENGDMLSYAIKYLIMDQSIRMSMSKNARPLIEKKFDQNLVWDEMLKLYDSLQ